jgi:leader peptidase (prepilin peptidase)/N-methyltransferase
MLIPLSLSALALSGVSAYLLTIDHNKQEEKRLKESTGDSTETKAPWLTKPFLILGIVMTVLSIGIAISLSLINVKNSFLFNIKRIALLSLLWPIALIDYKSYRIPNIFIIAGLSYRVIIFVFELVFEYEGIWTRGLSELIAAGALGLAALLCGLVLKNSIGFGDIKLFIVMGLLLGLGGIWNSIFVSLVISFIISIVLLITKKKKRKDAIPFAPAIMIGTYLSVFLTGT